MEELLLASSSVDAGIGCWNLRTGVENLRYKSCASPYHGLTFVGHQFIACSQIRDVNASSGSILYWSWHKPQVEVKSFPEEPIKALISNSEGTYIIGGGSRGNAYLWEVSTGRLLRKWHAHYRAITCLKFSEDCSLLFSGSEDGSVRVWSLFKIFDDNREEYVSHFYEYSFSEHRLSVTDIAVGQGGGNAIIVSSSEDRTCKVWSLSNGELLNNIRFSSVIDALVLDPGEHIFYAGSRDGKIYLSALNVDSFSCRSNGSHIIGFLSSHSKAVTCLAYSIDASLLLAGSEDGLVRAWNPKTQNIVRIFKHAKGPISNIHVVARTLPQVARSNKRARACLPPPLSKYQEGSPGEHAAGSTAVVSLHPACVNSQDGFYISSRLINKQIKGLQQGMGVAGEMEVDKLKFDVAQCQQLLSRSRKLFDELHQFCVRELLEDADANANV